MKIPILFEDNHLLVVEKPVNIPVQQDNSYDNDLLNLLKKDLSIRYKKPGNVFLGLVHRLDRPVGGVIAFAKTSKAASRLSGVIQKGEFQRRYLAVVRGTPTKKKGRLEHYLHKDQKKNMVNVCSPSRKNAKKAILDYELIASKKDLSLLSIKLHTGRSHQIRVQLSASGFPLYGDQKYGSKVNRPGQQIALWAYTLAFPHTTTKKIKNFKSTPPDEYPWSLWTKHH